MIKRSDCDKQTTVYYIPYQINPNPYDFSSYIHLNRSMHLDNELVFWPLKFLIVPFVAAVM